MMKVYKLTVCIVDFDDIGLESTISVLENQRFPNHCLHPRVVDAENGEVEWSDKHPLNSCSQERFCAAFLELWS